MPNSFAPYNFIPFSDVEIPVAYKSVNDLPSMTQLEAELDNKPLRSGWVDYTVRNETAISIGRENRDGFCIDGRGRYVIPGSTMRGFIRSHAEILSFSYPESIDSQRYLYRKIAGNCVALRKEYQDIFGIDAKAITPSKAKAGWLYCKDEQWYIQPVKPFAKTGTTFVSVPEKMLVKDGIIDSSGRQAMGGKGYSYEPYGLTMDYNGNLYTGRSRAQKISFDFDDNKRVKFPANGGGKESGGLFNAAWMLGKKRHLIVSLDCDECEAIKVDKELVEDYRRDLERTKKVEVAGGKQIPVKPFHNFYMLPGKGEKKIFFYLENESKKDGKRSSDIEEGIKEADGKEDCRILGIGPSQYFRLPFKHETIDGIPMKKPKGLDYVNALFGYTDKERSLKSRLSFQNAVYNRNSEDVDIQEDQVVLNSPQGTAFHMYLEPSSASDGNNGKGGKKPERSDIKSYNDDKFKLRGTKFYWKRSMVVESAGQVKNRRILSSLYSIPPGEGEFKGRVYFQNLCEDELGLLLMSIQFFNDGKESYMIGGGKPYGYGKVKIEDVGLYFQGEDDFCILNPARPDKQSQETVANLKAKFRGAIESLLDGRKYNDISSIKVYRDMIKADNFDAYLKDDIHNVYMQPGRGTELVPGYADYYPLELASTILERSKKQQTQKDVGDSKGIVWAGTYKLTSDQRKQLIRNCGKLFKEEKAVKKVDDAINQYAGKCDVVALPSDVSREHKDLAKEKFKEVWVARKTGRTDNGWICLQK